MIVAEHLRQHEQWREARARVESAPFVPRPRPVIKTIDVRPKPLLPLVRITRSSRDWLILTASAEVDAPNYLRIMHEVAAKHGITIPEMRSQRRENRLVIARQEAMWRMKKETSMTLPAIGRKLGDRDHTTVLYGVRKHEARLQEAKQV